MFDIHVCLRYCDSRLSEELTSQDKLCQIVRSFRLDWPLLIYFFRLKVMLCCGQGVASVGSLSNFYSSSAILATDVFLTTFFTVFSFVLCFSGNPMTCNAEGSSNFELVTNGNNFVIGFEDLRRANSNAVNICDHGEPKVTSNWPKRSSLLTWSRSPQSRKELSVAELVSEMHKT